MSKFFFMTDWLNDILMMFLYGKSYYIWFGKFTAVTHGQLHKLAMKVYGFENSHYIFFPCFMSRVFPGNVLTLTQTGQSECE